MKSLSDVEDELKNDDRVKLGAIDIDGIIRGKLISKTKLLAGIKDGVAW